MSFPTHCSNCKQLVKWPDEHKDPEIGDWECLPQPELEVKRCPNCQKPVSLWSDHRDPLNGGWNCYSMDRLNPEPESEVKSCHPTKSQTSPASSGAESEVQVSPPAPAQHSLYREMCVICYCPRDWVTEFPTCEAYRKRPVELTFLLKGILERDALREQLPTAKHNNDVLYGQLCHSREVVEKLQAELESVKKERDAESLLWDKTTQERDLLRAEVKALREDGERLDWLTRHHYGPGADMQKAQMPYVVSNHESPYVRDVIDAARAISQPQTEGEKS